jgi:hypothetical protein
MFMFTAHIVYQTIATSIFDLIHLKRRCRANQFLKCTNNFLSYSGLLLYRTVKNPYVMALSKSQGKKYWFNTRTGVAAFNIPPDSIAEVDLTAPSVALSHYCSEPDTAI